MSSKIIYIYINYENLLYNKQDSKKRDEANNCMEKDITRAPKALAMNLE